MSRPFLHPYWAYTLISLTTLGLPACSAKEPQPPASWKTDCVGLLQISFPGEVDMAAHSFTTLVKEFKSPSNNPPYPQFLDGQLAGYSTFQYQGSLLISHPITHQDFTQLAEYYKKRRSQAEKNIAQDYEKNPDGSRRQFHLVQPQYAGGAGWRVDASYNIFTKVGDSAVHWGAGVYIQNSVAEAEQESAAVFAEFEQAQPRPLYSLPPMPSVCLPYLSIPVTQPANANSRSIGMTYRLKDHPDITIWLSDRPAQGPQTLPPEYNASKFTVEYDNEFFWTNRYRKYQQLKSMWLTLHSVQFAQAKGKSSYVKLIRKNGSVDYGYYASVRGDPTQDPQASDIQFFVIREAQHALDKGKQPLPDDQFLALAQAIAASIKKRPAQP